MIASQMFVYFIFYSFLGWIWETIYCTLVEKHFQNRGFLFGPICPIYGVSVVLAQLAYLAVSRVSGEEPPAWKLFLIFAALSAVVEYTTSWFLEKRFHARWWDYSHLPLHVNGRICLPVTLCFGAGGVAIFRWLIPAALSVGSGISATAFEIIALLLMALFAADFALTEASLNSLLQRIEAAEQQMSQRGEAAYQAVSGTPQQIEQKIRNAHEEVISRVKLAANSLSYRERYIVKNIQRFSPIRGLRYSAEIGESLLRAVHERAGLAAGSKEEKASDSGDELHES